MDFTFTGEQETISGARVAATAQQVHGGIGIDISYPLHRYFLWAKHNELSLGPASAQLARLGSTYPRGPEGHL
jgi:3-oxocholest-4-en-26-oyl-CoA dehydrogenase beta subunit